MTRVQGPILRAANAARYLGISRAQFYRLIRNGRISPGIKLSKAAVGFPQMALDDFITRCAAERETVA